MHEIGYRASAWLEMIGDGWRWLELPDKCSVRCGSLQRQGPIRFGQQAVRIRANVSALEVPEVSTHCRLESRPPAADLVCVARALCFQTAPTRHARRAPQAASVRPPPAHCSLRPQPTSTGRDIVSLHHFITFFIVSTISLRSRRPSRLLQTSTDSSSSKHARRGESLSRLSHVNKPTRPQLARPLFPSHARATDVGPPPSWPLWESSLRDSLAIVKRHEGPKSRPSSSLVPVGGTIETHKRPASPLSAAASKTVRCATRVPSAPELPTSIAHDGLIHHAKCTSSAYPGRTSPHYFSS